MADIDKLLNQISGFFGVIDPIYAWCFDDQGTLLKSNHPDARILDLTLELVPCKARMVKHYQNSNRPYVAGLLFGVVWPTASFADDEGKRYVVAIGPVFSSQVTYRNIQDGLLFCIEQSPGTVAINELADVIQKLPTLPSYMIQRYVLMLHYMVTGEHLQISDISINNTLNPSHAQKWLKSKDRHKTWQTEQALFQAVREGDLNYKQKLANAQLVSKGVPVFSTTDPLRSEKVSAAVFASLCARAAIEGGLLPEEAYILGDYYTQKAENCINYSEMMKCTHEMYEEFILRVHKNKQNPNCSAQVQTCCNYIHFYVEEKLDIQMLADRVGYSVQHLCKKFKDETGMTINRYIRNAKIERAKQLLVGEDCNIDAIAARLHFSSRSYFEEVFLQITDMTPSAFRRNNEYIE